MKGIQQIGVWQVRGNHHRMYLGLDSWVDIRPKSLSDKKWEAALYFRTNFCESISGNSLGKLKNLIGKWQRETWKFVHSQMLEYRIGVNQEVSETWPRISDFPKTNSAIYNDCVPLSEYKPPRTQRPGISPPPPVAIRFWDGEQRELKYWHEILTSVVKKLYAERRLTEQDCPVQFPGHRLYCVHSQRVNLSGEKFGVPKKVEGTPLFVNVKLPIGQVMSNTKRLLSRFEKNPANVYLQVAG